MSLNIHESAIFIADAHYNIDRTDLKDLLEKIKLGEIETTQLFLMGDIFDYLAEQITYFRAINTSLIELINELSNSIDIVYLEGNHDYNLSNIFPNIDVYPLAKQPVMASYQNKKIALSHGDIYISKVYENYTRCIRNHTFLKVLNFLDRCNIISMNVEKMLGGKDKSYKFDNFNEFAQERIGKYEHLKCDMIIEGHFHQGRAYDKYINVPSLIDLKYARFINGDMEFCILDV